MRRSIVLLALASTAIAAGPDPRIRLVEERLLPMAAFEVGRPASIEDRMRAYGVPGLSIAVIDQGRLAWAKGYGFADTTTERRVTTSTRFQAASISKPISAIGALLLVQKGSMGLDDDVNDELLTWRIPTDSKSASGISLRMLLTHTSGLAHAGEGGPPFSMGDELPTSLETLTGKPPARGGPVVIAATPGKRFEYSAAGYEVLQQLVMDVSGKPFAEYMRRKVFGPLKMTNSTFAQPLPPDLLAAAATGYYAGGEPLPGRFRVSPELPVAGLWTTPTDLARYIISVQRAFKGSSGEILTTRMAREMLQPDANHRGLGPTLSGAGENLRFGHDGFNEGFESSFTAYVKEGRGAVVMANAGFSSMLIKEVLRSIASAYEWPEFGETAQQPPSANLAPQQVAPVPRAVLEHASGVFVAEWGIEIRLRASEDRLFLEWPGFGSAEIFATADGRFFSPPLIFSDVGSPWLQLVARPDGTIDRIRAADDGSVELRRVRS